MALYKGCPGANIFKDVKPEYIECPYCHAEIEIWSDELLARCPSCRRIVARQRGASCIDWCKYAAECIGAQKYQQLVKERPNPAPDSTPAKGAA